MHLGLDLWVRGERREAREQLRLAATDFRRALDDEPENANVQLMAAWFHIFCPDPQIRDEHLALEQARCLVRQVSVRDKDNPRLSMGIRPLFTLAFAQYRAGDWSAACSTIEESIRRKAAKLGETNLEGLVSTRSIIDAYDWYVWSMALARLGDLKSARRHFEEAALWTRRNRYGDFELHLLHGEAASLLGLSSTEDEMIDPPASGTDEER